jgi:hypothetical protein
MRRTGGRKPTGDVEIAGGRQIEKGLSLNAKCSCMAGLRPPLGIALGLILSEARHGGGFPRITLGLLLPLVREILSAGFQLADTQPLNFESANRRTNLGWRQSRIDVIAPVRGPQRQKPARGARDTSLYRFLPSLSSEEWRRSSRRSSAPRSSGLRVLTRARR